jgi:hypothetical protein
MRWEPTKRLDVKRPDLGHWDIIELLSNILE